MFAFTVYDLKDYKGKPRAQTPRKYKLSAGILMLIQAKCTNEMKYVVVATLISMLFAKETKKIPAAYTDTTSKCGRSITESREA